MSLGSRADVHLSSCFRFPLYCPASLINQDSGGEVDQGLDQISAFRLKLTKHKLRTTCYASLMPATGLLSLCSSIAPSCPVDGITSGSPSGLDGAFPFIDGPWRGRPGTK